MHIINSRATEGPVLKFDTPGRAKLEAWAKGQQVGPSEIARRMSVPGRKKVNPSMVSRWLSGDSRPDTVYQPILKQLIGTSDADWLTSTERARFEDTIARIAATGTDGEG